MVHEIQSDLELENNGGAKPQYYNWVLVFLNRPIDKKENRCNIIFIIIRLDTHCLVRQIRCMSILSI